MKLALACDFHQLASSTSAAHLQLQIKILRPRFPPRISCQPVVSSILCSSACGFKCFLEAGFGGF
jgi:hypothetical protein